MIKLPDEVLLLVLQLSEVDWCYLGTDGHILSRLYPNTQLLLVRLNIRRQHAILFILMRQTQQIIVVFLSSLQILVNLRVTRHVLRGACLDPEQSQFFPYVSYLLRAVIGPLLCEQAVDSLNQIQAVFVVADAGALFLG